MSAEQQKPTHVCRNCFGAFYLQGIERGTTITPKCCDKPTLQPIRYESADSVMKRLALQKCEFDAAHEFAKQVHRIECTPVVDDDYPSVRSDYEFALTRLVDALKKNGRKL